MIDLLVIQIVNYYNAYLWLLNQITGARHVDVILSGQVFAKGVSISGDTSAIVETDVI